jgi:hypothetical protein
MIRGREIQASSEVAESLFGPLILEPRFPSWEWKILTRPFSYRTEDQTKKQLVCNSYKMQNLASPELLNFTRPEYL